MLLNGSELKEQVKSVVSTTTSEITIISAFMKTSIINEIALLTNGLKVNLYVRWQLLDILRNASDFESLYETCLKNGFTLYYNHRLHSKMIISDRTKALIGSSNYTQSGLGSGNDNIEWNYGDYYLIGNDYDRIMHSLSESKEVTIEVIERFKEELSKHEVIIDFNELQKKSHSLGESKPIYGHVTEKLLPPFSPENFNESIPSHQEYLKYLGLTKMPPRSILVNHIRNSYYGDYVIENLHNQTPDHSGVKILRWGDIGYRDQAFFETNNGLYNLYRWLSLWGTDYHFFENPTGTCSLNFSGENEF